MTRGAIGVEPARFALLGAASGMLAAAAALVFHFGDVEVPRVVGVCFGFSGSGGRCEGVDGALYWFPGTIFGLLFGVTWLWLGRFDAIRAAGFAIASLFSNAIAVFVCVGLFDRFESLLEIDPADLPLSLAGAVAGLAGSALLSGVTRLLAPGTRLLRPIIAGAALGFLTPLIIHLEFVGTFLFYILWQGGYGAALAAALPRPG